MRGILPLSIVKLDPLGRVPKMLFKLEVLHSGRIGHWKIAATVDGSEIKRALTVEEKIRRLARLLPKGNQKSLEMSGTRLLTISRASGVIRSMNTGFCSIIPEDWTKRNLIEVFLSRSRILM